MDAAQIDRVWRALADPLRRRVLDALAGGPRTTGQLVEKFDGLCRTGVMKHLDLLVAAKLVIVRREGRTRWNYLNPVPLDRVCRRWMDPHVRRLSSALNRLKDVVEAEPPDPAAESTAEWNRGGDRRSKRVRKPTATGTTKVAKTKRRRTACPQRK